MKNYQRWMLIQPIAQAGSVQQQVDESTEVRRSRPRRRLMDQTPRTQSQTGGRNIWKKWQTYEI